MIFKSFIKGNVVGLKLYKSSKININQEIGYTLSSIIEKKHLHPSCKWTYLNKTYELNKACINNIFINKKFRNKYYGSFILDKTEKLFLSLLVLCRKTFGLKKRIENLFFLFPLEELSRR